MYGRQGYSCAHGNASGDIHAGAAPLFVPGSLGWLSEKIITSHHDNNYVEAVIEIHQALRNLFADDMADR
ncbi:MAG TPA: hypothetical protein VF503_15740 [Sphingobium sp.]|uniref:hypothetical protein n=1 Tax=Sphingobium sp. TaxID=1912891 RepID=UPI002ED16618